MHLLTQRTIIRPFNVTSDLETYFRWTQDKDLMTGYMSGWSATPPSLEKVRVRITGLTKDPHYRIFTILQKDTGKMIGYIGLNAINWHYQNANYTILIGERSYHGQGLGTEVTQAIIKYAFTDLKLHRIQLTVHADNIAAISAYRKAGFKIEGELRDDLKKNGSYVNRLVMAVIATDLN